MNPSYISPMRVSPEAGEHIDQYVVNSVLGEGTFGIVYKVKDTDGKVYALKLLRLYDLFPVNERPNVSRRFDLEFETAQINSPYLVPSFRKGMAKGNPYFIMHYCSNGSLRNKVGKNLSESNINAIAIDVLRGLKALHENGKIHRDLKPDNILLDENNIARLTDFGIAGHLNLGKGEDDRREVRLTTTDILGKPKERFGSYPYMPPEQIKPPNRVVTKIPANDIFSFGATFFEIITGQLPYGKISSDSELAEYILKVNKGRYTAISSYRKDISPVWDKIMAGCLHPDYKKRFSSADEVLNILGEERVSRSPVSIDNFVSLRIMQGEEPNEVYPISNMLKERNVGIITIGRNDLGISNSIAVKDDIQCYISRYHATIEKHAADRWYIRDGQWRNSTGKSAWVRSTNGTYVNGVEVDEIGTLLYLNDIITIGETTLKFQVS